MSWNYRVIEFTMTTGEAWQGIFEVYYDEAGLPRAHTSNPVSVTATTEDGAATAASEMRWTLERMLEALDKPILYESDFVNRDLSTPIT